MKPKSILCFGIVLAGVLIGVGNSARAIEPRPVIGPMPTNPPTKLQICGTWSNTTVLLLMPGSSNPPVKCTRQEVPAQRADFEVVPHPAPPYHHQFAIVAFHNPKTKANCITADDRTFYWVGKAGMVGYNVHPGGAHWGPSYLEMPDSEGDLKAAIAKFEKQCDGKTLNDALVQEMRCGVGFQRASPLFYFNVVPVGGAARAEIKVEGLEIMDNILRVDIRNLATKQPASYWIDPYKEKPPEDVGRPSHFGEIIKSVVDGHEMALGLNQPWADPK